MVTQEEVHRLLNAALQAMARKPCTICQRDPAGGAIVATHQAKAVVAPLCPTCMAEPQAVAQAGQEAFDRMQAYTDGLRRRQQAETN